MWIFLFRVFCLLDLHFEDIDIGIAMGARASELIGDHNRLTKKEQQPGRG